MHFEEIKWLSRLYKLKSISSQVVRHQSVSKNAVLVKWRFKTQLMPPQCVSLELK